MAVMAVRNAIYFNVKVKSFTKHTFSFVHMQATADMDTNTTVAMEDMEGMVAMVMDMEVTVDTVVMVSTM